MQPLLLQLSWQLALLLPHEIPQLVAVLEQLLTLHVPLESMAASLFVAPSLLPLASLLASTGPPASPVGVYTLKSCVQPTTTSTPAVKRTRTRILAVYMDRVALPGYGLTSRWCGTAPDRGFRPS